MPKPDLVKTQRFLNGHRLKKKHNFAFSKKNILIWVYSLS